MDREVQPGVPVTMEEYFATAHEYEVEPDFVDGYLEDRCIGEYPHASAMTAMMSALDKAADQMDCHALPSLSLRVSPTRVRVVDVCVIPQAYRKPIPDEPPLLCVEVLGSEDSLDAMVARCQDYLRMGVPEVWIVDPWRLEAFTLLPDRELERCDSLLKMRGSDVSVALDEVFDFS